MNYSYVLSNGVRVSSIEQAWESGVSYSIRCSARKSKGQIFKEKIIRFLKK